MFDLAIHGFEHSPLQEENAVFFREKHLLKLGSGMRRAPFTNDIALSPFHVYLPCEFPLARFCRCSDNISNWDWGNRAIFRVIGTQ